MQKKKNTKIAEKKKEKKWEKKHTIGFILFVLVFFLPLSIKIFEFIQEKNTGTLEYTGGCFLRSIHEGTGRNAAIRFEVIPSNLAVSSLPTFEITQEVYEKLGGKYGEENSQQVCTDSIFIKYSPGSQSLHSLEIL